MAELNTDGGGGHGKHEKKRAKKASTKIDMTPMVDLAFLLLTFFMLTTTFSKPSTMEITMPVKDDKVPEKATNNAVTIILSEKDQIFYYFGELKETTVLEKTNFSADKGIRKLLTDANKRTIAEVKQLENKFKSKQLNDSTFKKQRNTLRGAKEALAVIIKTDDKAKYRNVVDMIDEMSIAEVGKYALVDISPLEKQLLAKLNP